MPADVAAQLVACLAAESISQTVIRMLPPDSQILKASPMALKKNYVPDRLPAREVSGVKFQAPPEHPTGVPRSRYLPRRREQYGEWQMRRSLELAQ